MAVSLSVDAVRARLSHIKDVPCERAGAVEEAFIQVSREADHAKQKAKKSAIQEWREDRKLSTV